MAKLPRRTRTARAIREELAEHVRTAYLDERRGWNRNRGGGLDNFKPGAHWDQVWLKMADYMVKHQIDNYRQFIHVQFKAKGNLAICPKPTECYGAKALERWNYNRADQADFGHELLLALNYQLEKLQERITSLRLMMPQLSHETVDDSVLLDNENGLTALFRYCVAVKSLRPRIASRYRDGAILQYLFGQEQYNQVWKDLIPATLNQEANKLRLGWLQPTE